MTTCKCRHSLFNHGQEIPGTRDENGAMYSSVGVEDIAKTIQTDGYGFRCMVKGCTCQQYQQISDEEFDKYMFKSQ